MKLLKILTAISIIIFICFIAISYLDGTYGWIPDIIFFIALVFFYYIFYDLLRLNPLIFTLLVFSHILHACGVFGWYGTSPLPIQWDHITHFFGAMPFAMLFWNFLYRFKEKKIFTKKNLILLLLVFFAAFGVAALVEMIEFIGYLRLGYGDHGALFFGAGDADPYLMDVVGGGWINAGWDYVYNTIGILTGMAIMISLSFVKKIFRK